MPRGILGETLGRCPICGGPNNSMGWHPGCGNENRLSFRPERLETFKPFRPEYQDTFILFGQEPERFHCYRCGSGFCNGHCVW